MKIFLKWIWVLILSVGSFYAITSVFDNSKPRTRYDPEKSKIVCDNGKSFLMSDFSQDLYKSDREYFRYEYECSDLFGKISFDEYKKNFTENYHTEQYREFSCDNKLLIIQASDALASVPAEKSIIFYRYKCSDYSDSMTIEEYEEHFGRFDRDFKFKEIESNFKQILYTIFSTLVLVLFLYLKAFKKFGKLPMYFKIFVAIGDLSAIIFFMMLFNYLLVSASS